MGGRELIIYHTNDLHGRLDVGQAECIRQMTAERPGILLDAGDAVSAGNLGVRPGGERVLRLMTELGYTAMAMGNREFHPFAGLMKRKLSGAGFPVLCANLEERRGPDVCRPSLVIEYAGQRIGLIGLCRDMLNGTPFANIAPFRFVPPVEALMREITILRDTVDLFILLSHLGLKVDISLAQQVEDLDLIIGVHSHDVLPEGLTVGRTMIVQTGAYADRLGMVCRKKDQWKAMLHRTGRKEKDGCR